MKTTTVSRFTSLNKLGVLACLAGLLLFAAPQVRADDEDTSKDPPKRVARISIIEGSVSLQPGGEGDWGTAAKNRPVTIGDKIWVDKDSRAELQAGEAAFHLGSMTALSFLNLDEGITQVRIPEGAVNFRVRELRQGDVYEIDTPNAVFNVKQAGAFRIDVNEAGDSARITVIRGDGEVTVAGKTYEVHAGEQGEFNGTEDNPTYSIMHAPSPDGLDKWAEERDLREDRSVSGNYVSRDIPGYDDLDDHGTWSEQPGYGHVWYPNDVGPDWAPYSDGYWNWVDPWGWTWVGYEPWGFAPYHYGRWAFIGGRWGWCPGPYYGYPVYGPAFVGWLGGGWGFGFGFGVGWFPLGWGEPFFPWFGCSHNFVTIINVHNTFIRNVNVLNNRNFNFVNAHNLRAVTTTSRNNFTNGGRINRGGQHLTQAGLNGARATNSVGIRPTQHSTLGASNFNSHVARPPAGVQGRAVMARTAPAAAASHSPVRSMNGATTAGRFANPHVNGAAGANAQVGNSGAHNNMRTRGQFENRPGNNAPANSGVTARQREIAQNRPPSARSETRQSMNGAAGNNSAQRAGNGRTWEAQSNATDRGRAPQGLGSNRPSNAPAQNSPRSMGDRPAQSGASSTSPHARVMSDRPPWAGNGGPRGNSGSSAPSYNRGGSYDNRGFSQQPSYSPRSYSSPRTYSAPGRSYPAPSRPYSPPPSRSYGGGGSYSAPRSYGGGGGYSAPRSYGGGGGSPRSYGGGGGSHSYGGAGYSGGSHSSGGGGHVSSGGGGHASSGGGGSHGGGGGHPHR
ncbi:MAG TPA: DUF6600 domain-containing protein [Candidatus Bathyarchaeia archaeon]|jgi:hypothetical protein|nr:DUF6600 domain-containing protein [Candidatus Bathyarchaeia archaeon]